MTTGQSIIHDGADFTLVHQPVSEFGVPVVVKQLKGNEFSPDCAFQLKNEFEQTYDLAIPGIRKALKLDLNDGRNALYLEYVEGDSMRQFFQNRTWNLKEIVSITSQVAHILAGIHAHGIVHKDVNPRNILIGNSANEVTLIDFGIATRLHFKSDYSINPYLLEGSLAYISPEQTGRMNRLVDSRSDLYSLGVTLYELLTRGLPFEATDAVEFVYCHIASNPVPPHAVNPQIPEVLSNIVMKLLEKNAEHRYQSALGLKHDLDRVLASLGKNEPVSAFTLGRNDFSNRFQIPQKLYGRENEVAELLLHFDTAAKGGSSACFVTGFSGVGKSALVHEIYRPVTSHRGIFIEGKFDQYQRNIPYQAFSFAFRNFVQQLMGENEQRLGEWRSLFVKAVGDNAGVITALIPEFELIIGEQEPPPPLGPIESQNRFNFTFVQFIKELASPEHPLVLFLDDLQSADLASLNLLRALISDNRLSSFYFIGAYRDNEVSSEHPLQGMINELLRTNVELHTIQLKGLSEKSLMQLISDTLKCDLSKSMNLASIVNRKTDSNPYFINEFLKSLYEDEVITWNADESEWQWEEARAEEKSVTENVVQFLTRRINAYPQETLDLMKLASCIGNSFPASMLEGVAGKPLAHIHQHLEMMMGQGYLIPVGIKEIIAEGNQTYSVFPFYKFVHDRFQQAIYSLIGEQDRAEIHLKIGLHLLPQKEKGETEVFALVNHLNQAKELITGAPEKWQLCQLNYEAGMKAKNSSAWNAANQYFRAAMSLLPVTAWEEHYDFTFTMVLERAQAEFLNGSVMESEQLMDGLLAKGRNDYERAVVLSQKIVLYSVLGKYKEAVDISKQSLRLLKIRVPRTSAGMKVGILRGILRVKLKLRKKEPEYLLSLPENKSREGNLIFKVISDATVPSYFSDREYYMIIQLAATNYSIDKGNTQHSAFAYACYLIVVIALFRSYRYVSEFFDVLLRLSDRYYTPLSRGRLLSPMASGFAHWIMPLAESVTYYHEGIAHSTESGDLWYTGNIRVNHMAHTLRMGKNLRAVYDEFNDFSIFVSKQNNVFLTSEYELYVIWIRMMSEGVSNQDISAFEEKFVAENRNNQFLIGYLCTFLCRYHYLMQDFDLAWKYGEKAKKLIQQFVASPSEADAHFYYATTATRITSLRKKKMNSAAEKSLKLFEIWEKICPENFSCYANILRGELTRLEGKVSQALGFFQQAAMHAKENQFTHVEALANELAGRLCMSIDFKFEGHRYLKKAVTSYTRWGAFVKVKQMKQEFPDIEISDSTDRTTSLLSSTIRTQSIGLFSEKLDLATIMKASTALSGEVKFSQLLNTMMKITMENAGAQSGILFLEKNKEALPKIPLASDRDNVKLVIGIPGEEDAELPVSLVQYVYRTKEDMVLDDAAEDFRFSRDAYFKKYEPQSVLCIPILHQGNLIGVLYLENRLTVGAFTSERLNLIRLLSGQIAVSIENSLVYETLEQRVTERTEEVVRQRDVIEQEKQKSDRLLLNILPEETAEELKVSGTAKPRRYENVTVMFTDFVNFTQASEQLSASELVEEINFYYSAFDEIVRRHGLEKIKTIGDSYMCAGGLPVENSSHAVDMVKAALAIQQFIFEANTLRIMEGKPAFRCRIGIHTGAVVAGIVGTTKFAYDIWGDTVNIASRMETGSDVGKVNVSGSTFELIKEYFICTYRGKLDAKNKGLIDMYYIDEVKPNGDKPDFAAAEKFMLDKLKNELPHKLTYHGVHHTLDVMNAAMMIADREKISEEERKLLRVAVSFHDAGFIYLYRGHEEKGCEMAREFLPRFGFNDAQIVLISGMIMATKLPQQPHTQLERIIADADLDYLGRDDFYPIGKTLYKEFLEQGFVKDENHWNEVQLSFLRSHGYHTTYGKQNRDAEKQERMKEIELLVAG